MNEHWSKWTHNSKRLQSHLSNVCGQYCIAYVLLRCNGFPMRTFVTIFGTDLVANGCRVFDRLKQLRQGRLYYRASTEPLARWTHPYAHDLWYDGKHPQVASSSPSSLCRGGDTPKLTTCGVVVNTRKLRHHHHTVFCSFLVSSYNDIIFQYFKIHNKNCSCCYSIPCRVLSMPQSRNNTALATL